MQRCIEPEWLDELPASDARAHGARRDLRRVNWLMGNAAILAKALRAAAPQAPRSVVDLGGGDGAVALALARRLAPHWPSVRLTLVDRAAAVSRETAERIQETGWRIEVVAADVFEWSRVGAAPFDVVIANLFLHHFEDAGLRRLFAELAKRATVFAACEPRRDRLALIGSRLLFFIGCNKITRHDAPASVWAGFAGRELSALWPEANGWSLAERQAGWASHLFLARRGLPGAGGAAP
jgi:SAM-dependent methyltransferase